MSEPCTALESRGRSQHVLKSLPVLDQGLPQRCGCIYLNWNFITNFIDFNDFIKMLDDLFSVGILLIKLGCPWLKVKLAFMYNIIKCRLKL